MSRDDSKPSDRQANVGLDFGDSALHAAGRFTLAFVLACAASSAVVWIAAACDAPWRSPEKFARTALIPSFLVAYVLIGKSKRPPFAVATALAMTPATRRFVLLGYLSGAGALVAFLGVSAALGWWAPKDPIDPWGEILGKGAFYLFAGFFLALWEEGLFRGLIYGDVSRVAGTRAAVGVSTALFSVSHLLGPPNGPSLAWSEAWIGPRAMWANLAGLSRVVEAWPHLLGLAIVGWILARFRARTGSAWLGVGIHAGWFFVMKMDGRFLHFTVPEGAATRIWSGSPEYCDGVAGWCALLLTYFAAAKLTPADRSAKERAP